MEAKSYGVPSASWRPRRAGGMVQSMSEGENQEHRGPRAGEDGCPSSNSKFTLPRPLCPILTLKDLDDVHPHWGGWSSLLSLPIQMLISPWNTLMNTQRYCWPATWASPNPVKLTHKTNHHKDFPGGPVVKNPPSHAGDSGSIPGQGTKIPHAAGQLNPCVPQLLSSCASTREPTGRKLQSSRVLEPARHNCRAHAPWSSCTTTRERKPACRNEEPTNCNK